MSEVVNMNRFPKPPIGLPVVWYPLADTTGTPLAATITRSDGYGKVWLAVQPTNQIAQLKKDVEHVLHPVHHNTPETTRRNGGWDFVCPALDQRTYAPGIDNLAEYLTMKIPKIKDVDAVTHASIIADYVTGLQPEMISRNMKIDLATVKKALEFLHREPKSPPKIETPKPKLQEVG